MEKEKEDYYQILDVSKDADETEIKKAYRKLGNDIKKKIMQKALKTCINKTSQL